MSTVVALCYAAPAHAFIVSDELEAVVYPSVGATWQSVTFENSFTNPIPVCTYVLPSVASNPATVRIRSISGTGMQIKIQGFPSTSPVTASAVHCIIAEAGAHTLPDGRAFEARSVLTINTHGQNATSTWTQSALVDASSSVTGTYTSPVVLGQVISANSANASVFYTTDCDSRANRPFQSGMSDGICVGKHIGQVSGNVGIETVGFIVAESGTGILDDTQYQLALGADNVAGTGNSPPYSYSTNATYEVGVATQAAEDGGNGSWAVMYGTNPLAGNQIDLAVEEETQQGDASRGHTTEELYWWAFRRVPDFQIEKTVDFGSIAEAQLLTYEIVLENTGQLNLSGIVITDTLPGGAAGTVTGPTESFTSGTAGVLEPDETWTYTVSFTPSTALVSGGGPLVNNVSAGTAQYTSFGKANETANVSTLIIPAITNVAIEKTASFSIGSAPASVGDVIVYTYDVTNNGNVTLSEVTISDVHNGLGDAPDVRGEVLLTDVLPLSDSTDVTSDNGIWSALKPGDAVRFTWEYTVVQQDIDQLQ